MTKITFVVAEIIIEEDVITSYVPKIIFKVVVVTSFVAYIIDQFCSG